jgi:hypothetical protein
MDAANDSLSSASIIRPPDGRPWHGHQTTSWQEHLCCVDSHDDRAPYSCTNDRSTVGSAPGRPWRFQSSKLKSASVAPAGMEYGAIRGWRVHPETTCLHVKAGVVSMPLPPGSGMEIDRSAPQWLSPRRLTRESDLDYLHSAFRTISIEGAHANRHPTSGGPLPELGHQ